MLRQLSIRNLAIIDRVEIEFGPGFNVITGETGAGKSVVLQAIELVVGRRASEHLIRTGAEALDVQAVFDLSMLPTAVRSALPDIVADDDELLISRTVTRAGKGKVLLNGNLATVKVLEDVSSRIINLCGQNHQVRLLDAAYHRELLDGFANNEEERRRYAESFSSWRTLRENLEAFNRSQEENATRHAELEMRVRELEPLGVRPGLRSELEQQVKEQGSAETVLELGQAVLRELGDEGALSASLRAVQGTLHELQRVSPPFQTLESDARSIAAALGELERDLVRTISRVTVDETKLAELRNRLAEVARLERKYRCDDAGLTVMLQEALAELAELSVPNRLHTLVEGEQRARDLMVQAATALTETRRRAGVALAKLVRAELKDLAMGDAEIQVVLEECQPSQHGCEGVEFMIAANRGEGLRPLKLVASGGELARITLVLKKLLREQSGINVLVFDEVDTGVSGRVARALGEKLRELARLSQVICITHLPQVASLADRHFLVSKGGSARTTSRIEHLTEGARVEEIARMLAGYEVTPSSRESARELLSSKPK